VRACNKYPTGVLSYCLRYGAGTPFQFLVTDLNKASARGDGLGSVKSGQVATFFVTAPAAQLKDINVTICGIRAQHSHYERMKRA